MNEEYSSAWSKFRKRVTINAEPQAIYNAFASQIGLESWFLRKAQFLTTDGRVRKNDELIQAGDKYVWLWHGYGDDESEKREILEANNRNYLVFNFSGGCKVSVRIKKAGGENLLELIQEDIVFEENPYQNLFVSCGEGWTFYLANLKSYLEGGIDLRNKNSAIQNVINA
ncbi:MAG: SRPBCC domain-containing protein [Pyrinomonadaceae bacterium]